MLTPAECDAVSAAYNDAREQEERSAWERARVVGYSSASPYFGKGKRMTPQKYLPFPWDNKKPPLTPPVGEDATRKESARNKAAIAQLAALCGG